MYKAKDTRSGRIVSAGEASPYGTFPLSQLQQTRLSSARRRPGRPFRPSVRLAGMRTLCPLGRHRRPVDHSRRKAFRGRRAARRKDCSSCPEHRARAGGPEGPPKAPPMEGLRHDPEIRRVSTGRISFDSGGGVRRTVPLSTLALSAHTHPVDPDAADYGAIWTSPEVPQRLSGCRHTPVAGPATGPDHGIRHDRAEVQAAC